MTDQEAALKFIENLAIISHGKHDVLWVAYCELSLLTDYKYEEKYSRQLGVLGKLIREVANVPVD